nr:MAG TPA: ASCH domain protein [Caudoviricetes sp.]
MKKILFNDKFCLTQSVLSGIKTMTRRKFTLTLDKKVDGKFTQIQPSKVFFDNDKWFFDYNGKTYNVPKENYPRYKVGEVVAIAQSYHTLNKAGYIAPECCEYTNESSAGYKNKMFVRADLMPHHIKITDIKVEHLQDISDEDILCEGVWQILSNNLFYISKNVGFAHTVAFPSAREAFEYLIDKVSGDGTWTSNPLVVVYKFELVD